MRKIAVISTGNGGQTMSAYFAARGYEVALYAREKERVDMFPENNVFELDGIEHSRAKITLISSDMREVVKGAFLIMVTTPAQYQHVIAKEMAPHLEDGQMVLLNPGRTFGTYMFEKTLRESGCTSDYLLAEAETFIFTCRCEKPGYPILYGIKNGVKLAAHDPTRTEDALKIVSEIFPQFVGAPSVLETGFGNMGMVLHPLPILTNITRIEAKERILFYLEAISPLVANIIERLDAERVAVAKAYGVNAQSAFEWLGSHYGSKGDTLYERIQNNEAYHKIYAPTDIDTRYIYEDILTGCVPVCFAARHAGIKVPIIESVIMWASTIYQYDFLEKGRNDKKIDFDAMLRTSAK